MNLSNNKNSAKKQIFQDGCPSPMMAKVISQEGLCSPKMPKAPSNPANLKNISEGQTSPKMAKAPNETTSQERKIDNFGAITIAPKDSKCFISPTLTTSC